MPSTVTTPVSTRLRPRDVDRLRQMATARNTTVSSLLASAAQDTLRRDAASA
jgi:hypothetical protein